MASDLRNPLEGVGEPNGGSNVEELEFRLSMLVEAFCARRRRSVMLEWSSRPGSSVGCNPDVRRAGAGLMKLCLVGTIIELAERAHLRFDQLVKAHHFARSRYPSLSHIFDREHVFTLRELCRLTLATGDNPMATALADLCTVDDVHDAMLHWGVAPDSFSYVAGYTDEELSQLNRHNSISARATMTLLRRFTVDPNLIDFAVALTNGTKGARIPARLPAEATVAQITGTFDGVANDAGMIEIDGKRIWLVVLSEDEPDTISADAEIAELAAQLAHTINDNA